MGILIETVMRRIDTPPGYIGTGLKAEVPDVSQASIDAAFANHEKVMREADAATDPRYQPNLTYIRIEYAFWRESVRQWEIFRLAF